MIKKLKKIKIEKVDNGIGGHEEHVEVIGSFGGYIDMLTGNRAFDYNANLQESTHVILTKEFTIDYKDYILDEKNNLYSIDYIDDPVGTGHHLEIYVKHLNKRIDENEF